MEAPTHLWHNGRIKTWADATVHVGAHALHYGSSVFEGIRVYDTPDGPRYFRLDEHTERLFHSARIYDLSIAYDAATINRACREVITANGLKSAYVRPIVFRSGFTFSLAPSLDTAVDVAIIALPWGAYHGADAIEKGVDVCVSSWNRAAPNTYPSGAKAGGNYLNSQLIAREAINGGFAEGIALGTDGLLSEGAGENLFIVRKGTIYTPPAASSILCGITRDAVLTLARDRGFDVVEQPLPREMLYFADEVFMTGTAAEVTAVRSVDRKPVGSGRPGPVTRQLQDAFFGLFDGRTEDRWGWLTPVEEATSGRAAA
ncbi:branched-chain amino acid aminotransferase [Luteibacter sp. UNCMF331Sha3.1]|jgi:branched-chain amino acid aminotransferase|uniref:branched-chain amino acid transaminase n=1 Tax=Luteibacter sp. UNCMF331Sha3.1 TaxID=1502760 RepID=UPI0008B71090|nr:branched-chain amino acid transaminase [Luteibacter sp. UNCMF331Sha3.1]SEM47574.1 branched-chain amino acid aminotransferase [Luteibacter sp. UNCMF331Sha3.1]